LSEPSFHCFVPFSALGQIDTKPCLPKIPMWLPDITKVGHEGTGLESVGRYTWFGAESPVAAVVNVVMSLWIP